MPVDRWEMPKWVASGSRSGCDSWVKRARSAVDELSGYVVEMRARAADGISVEQSVCMAVARDKRACERSNLHGRRARPWLGRQAKPRRRYRRRRADGDLDLAVRMAGRGHSVDLLRCGAAAALCCWLAAHRPTAEPPLSQHPPVGRVVNRQDHLAADLLLTIGRLRSSSCDPAHAAGAGMRLPNARRGLRLPCRDGNSLLAVPKEVHAAGGHIYQQPDSSGTSSSSDQDYDLLPFASHTLLSRLPFDTRRPPCLLAASASSLPPLRLAFS